MDRNLALELTRVTESAAIASARMLGRGDPNGADQAAVTAMRERFNDIAMDGTVVIGEGERDEAPMLYIGEKVGTGDLPEVDIALDPLECTNSVAYGRPNALAVVAIAPKGHFLHAPDTYMEKIAVGPEAVGIIDINRTATENLNTLAEVKKVQVSDLTVAILDRERHEELIKEVRELGCRIHLIPDGDVSAAIACAVPDSTVDILMGIGGAPEGVLAAAALRGLGGDMQGRLAFRNEGERQRAISMGVEDPSKVFEINELARGDDIMFVATGITDGDFLRGVGFYPGGAKTHSMVIRSKSGTLRFIETEHRWNWKP
ncbi:class II fructose-bisphosphatase [bacterium]|nr:class II fructose-bisphosphatase [bacterium]